MLDMMKRHEIQVLRKAGHSLPDVARLTGVSERTVRRVEGEPAVTSVFDGSDARRRSIGRPSKAEAFRAFVSKALEAEPDVLSLEILRRARLDGYQGGKSAFYALVAALRPKPVQPVVRFEGLPGEFSQHDFGHVDVRFMDGTTRRVHFFASRLKYSRWVEVTMVANERVETLLRTLVDHFAAFGGIPLVAVFDRPKTVALHWAKDGTVTEWNPTFAAVTLDLGLGVEVCWPRRGNQKGAVENLVGWVKGSFFKQRRFLDEADLLAQLAAWKEEANTQRPSRATGVTPATRMSGPCRQGDPPGHDSRTVEPRGRVLRVGEVHAECVPCHVLLTAFPSMDWACCTKDVTSSTRWASATTLPSVAVTGTFTGDQWRSTNVPQRSRMSYRCTAITSATRPACTRSREAERFRTPSAEGC